MFLTKTAISDHIKQGNIEIEPFDPKLLNPNSYNVRLGPELLVYEVVDCKWWHRLVRFVSSGMADWLGLPPAALDLRRTNKVRKIKIPKEGYVLKPGMLYLGSTVERTCSRLHVPMYEGRSSTARLGLESHICGGWGDVGFDGTWTLEIRCTHPIRIYPGMEIGQVAFANVEGKIIPYGAEGFRSRYQGQLEVTPAKPFGANE
jgi:dCTP deaminase